MRITRGDTTKGSSSVRVAVIDTGIDRYHPEFSGRIYAQTDVVDNDGNASDDQGHGTHVAGIVAANDNNSKGGTGVAPNVKLIIVDAFCSNGSAYTSDILEGIDYAVSKGADVINMSLGNYYYDSSFEAKINWAVYDKGVVCVAAAGNDATSQTHLPERLCGMHFGHSNRTGRYGCVVFQLWILQGYLCARWFGIFGSSPGRHPFNISAKLGLV